jgi:thermostable 8-oxoguanine DNA glycosylase
LDSTRQALIIHPDRPYTDAELESFMVFCLLDRAQPYAKVCAAYDALCEYDVVALDSRATLKAASEQEIAEILKSQGYRFPQQAAKFLHAFGSNPIDLRNATREQLIDSILGVGPKLASLFIRNTRKGASVSVLDVHVKRWLAERGYDPKLPYAELEKAFLNEAKKLGRDPGELDLEIWEERRIKPKTDK